jgi:hypothetical protein
MSPPSRRIDTLTPPFPTHRTKPMCILILSPARSGTTSIEAALTHLNYTVYRGMKHAFLHARRGENRYQEWSEALDAKYPSTLPNHSNKSYGVTTPYTTSDFEKILAPYDAISGWPASCFVDEMLTAYPSAKVILMKRDKRAWSESMRRTLCTRLTWWSWRFILPLENGLIRDCIECGQRCLNVWTNGDPWDREALERCYEEHNAYVKKVVPQERLLELDVKAGWGPLCEFLGVEVPDTPYPREAVGGAFEKQGRMFWLMAVAKVAGKGVMLGTLVGAGVYAFRFWRSMKA